MARIPDRSVVTNKTSGLLMTLYRFDLGLIRNRDVGDNGRFAHRLPGERRALFEPGARRRRAPQRLPARILQRPAQRFVVVVAGEVVAGVEFEAVAVGIPDVEEERIRDAVAARAALDV